MGRRGWIILGLLAAAVIAVHLSGLSDGFSLDSVQARRMELLALADTHPVPAALGFVALYALVVSLSLPVAVVGTLLGGFLFGPLLGTLLAVVGATTGASIVFLIARSAVGEGLRSRAGPLYGRVAAGMRANAFEYLLFLRLVPLFPFFLVNIVPALFEVRLRTFALATAVGIVPGTFVYANLGRELGSISSLADLVSPMVLVAFLLLGLVALVPVAYRRWKSGGARDSLPAALVAVGLAAAAAPAVAPPSQPAPVSVPGDGAPSG
jgi:uncharacterized membrane protein YdjX (TVP38/TMEM64 family)